MNDLMKRILKGLSFNMQPSAFHLSVDRSILISTLEELKKLNLITFEYIKDHPVFNGEAKNVRLTTKGEEVAKECMDVII